MGKTFINFYITFVKCVFCFFYIVCDDLCDAAPDQENATKVTLSQTSSVEPQEALKCSSSRCDVDM